MEEIRNCWYRVSIKALVLNETRDKFLIVKEDNGKWELPGGGLDWGVTPQEDLPREIDEEMGIPVNKVAEHPSYFFTFNTRFRNGTDRWVSNVVYEAELEHLNFTPSDECVDLMFVDKNDIEGLDMFEGVQLLAEQFDSKRHK